MKKTWFAGLAIILLTNVVVLGGVAYNRSGGADRQLVLSERELGLPYSGVFSRENSGISLFINWRIVPVGMEDYAAYNNRWSAVEWLDAARLGALGFRVEGATATKHARERFNRGLSREVWLVLENNGAAYQAMRERVNVFYRQEKARALHNPDDRVLVNRASQAEKQWDREQREASRLFVIDAGLDPAALQGRYPDRNRYCIVRGQLRAAVVQDDDDNWSVRGFVQGLAVESVNVPRAFRHVFAGADGELSRQDGDRPHYSVTLAYGKRREPWIVAAQKTTD